MSARDVQTGAPQFEAVFTGRNGVAVPNMCPDSPRLDTASIEASAPGAPAVAAPSAPNPLARQVRQALGARSAAEALGEIRPGVELAAVTDGRVSLLDCPVLADYLRSILTAIFDRPAGRQGRTGQTAREFDALVASMAVPDPARFLGDGPLAPDLRRAGWTFANGKGLE